MIPFIQKTRPGDLTRSFNWVAIQVICWFSKSNYVPSPIIYYANYFVSTQIAPVDVCFSPFPKKILHPGIQNTSKNRGNPIWKTIELQNLWPFLFCFPVSLPSLALSWANFRFSCAVCDCSRLSSAKRAKRFFIPACSDSLDLKNHWKKGPLKTLVGKPKKM